MVLILDLGFFKAKDHCTLCGATLRRHPVFPWCECPNCNLRFDLGYG